MSGTRETWRLVVDGPVPAVVNMAVDRAVQVARDAGDAPPTLRLYQWLRPTLTLGKFQDASAVDVERARAAGVDVVRRFTGGRGVLHDDEVTYSVVASVSDGVPKGISASYRFLSGALAASYRALGVDAEIVPREAGVKGSAACYLHSTQADLSLRGRKLSGSAQVWLHDTVLQHGSFVLTRDVQREAAVFGLDAEHAQQLAETTITLADELAVPPTREQVIEAAIAGFSKALGIELEPGALTDDERGLAEQFAADVEVGE